MILYMAFAFALARSVLLGVPSSHPFVAECLESFFQSIVDTFKVQCQIVPIRARVLHGQTVVPPFVSISLSPAQTI